MTDSRQYFAIAMMGFALAGCAVSGGVDQSKTARVPVSSAQLPPPPVVAEPLDGVTQPEKFQHPEQQVLAVQSVADADRTSVEATDRVAYASAAAAERSTITTTRADLKPFVGRWALATSTTRAKMEKIGAYLGVTDRCELVLEDADDGVGHKAKGSSACPTSLFMLDSWTAFEGRLVLKDHMGDDIVQLRSRGSGSWVGVSRDGTTIVLEKS